MKIAIYYDSLLNKGGGQKVVIELANRLHADIITCGINDEVKKWMPINGKVIDLGNRTYNFSPPFSFFFEIPFRFFLYKNNKYDINIFFGIFSIFSSKKGKKNIWYCFTPNRLLYDLRAWKLNNVSFIKKLFLKAHIYLFETLDQKYIKNNMSLIIAQTKHVQKRISKYYGKKSSLIYSPLDTSLYRFDKTGDFYLAVSRLVPEKRVDVIAKAFTKLPNHKLIIVGQGPEEKKLAEISKNHKNIKILTDVNEEKLIELYANCLAAIYIPVAEDFGLVPIEAMASGKICIVANEGGCKESILDAKTGYLIRASEGNLIKKILTIKDRDLVKMKDVCLKRAQNFDINKCVSSWDVVLNKI